MKVILYTTHCPKCKVLTTKLQRAGIAFLECDDVDTMLAAGIKSAPMLSVDGKLLDFVAATQWVNNGGVV